MNVGILHTAFVGDLACLGLLIEALHQSGHCVTLFTTPLGVEIYQHDRRVSLCMPIQKGRKLKKLTQLLHNAAIIRQHKQLEVLLVPHRSMTSSLTAWFSGIKKTIGFKDAAFASLYNEASERPHGIHESAKYLNLAPTWLVESTLSKKLNASGRPVLNSRPSIDRFFTGQGLLAKLTGTSNFFLLAPSSIWGTKIYPYQHYATVAMGILNVFPNMFCLITGSSADRDLAFKLLQEFPESLRSRVIDTTGSFTIGELISLTAKAKLVLSNDSAPVHLASGTNTPTLAIFGPTIRESGFWPLADQSLLLTYKDEHGKPLPCQPCGAHGPKACPLGHHRCMKDLSPSFILEKALTLLNKA
jgi:heptosyltransferase-2